MKYWKQRFGGLGILLIGGVVTYRFWLEVLTNLFSTEIYINKLIFSGIFLSVGLAMIIMGFLFALMNWEKYYNHIKQKRIDDFETS